MSAPADSARARRSSDGRIGIDEIVVTERDDAAVAQLTDALAGVPGLFTRRIAGRRLWCLLGEQQIRAWPRVVANAVGALRSILRIGAMATTAAVESMYALARVRDRYVVFTSPDQASLVRLFRRRVGVYYVIDDFVVGHDYWSEQQVQTWEQELVGRCAHTVAVSAALAAKLERRLGLLAGSVRVSPNAVAAGAIPASCPDKPADLGPDGATLRRPVIGILGSISSRLRLPWLRYAVQALPHMTWLFAGWLDEVEIVPGDREHIDWLRSRANCHFTGPQSCADLLRWAAGVDVALLPYSDRSVNPCGSSMRFFMHLPFGQPIVATPGCEQLEEFSQVVTICRSQEALVAELRRLEGLDFDDGMRRLRWELAKAQTWERRAEDLVALMRSAHAMKD